MARRTPRLRNGGSPQNSDFPSTTPPEPRPSPPTSSSQRSNRTPPLQPQNGNKQFRQSSKLPPRPPAFPHNGRYQSEPQTVPQHYQNGHSQPITRDVTVEQRPRNPHTRSAPAKQSSPPMPFRITARGFPEKPQTIEIMSIFEGYGTIKYIGINDDKGFVTVEFEREPASPFWERPNFIGTISKKIIDGVAHALNEPIAVYLECRKEDRQRPVQYVPSPRMPNLKFHPNMSVQAARLSLNVLVQEDSVMEMYTPFADPREFPPRFSVSLDVDPESQFIDIDFTEWTLPTGGDAEVNPDFRQTEHRIRIKLKKIVSSAEYQVSPTHRKLMIHLDYPPLFFTRTIGEYASHDADGQYWKDDFDWVRQTDLIISETVKDDLLNKKPIGHRKPPGHVDLGKWTTYIIDLDLSSSGMLAQYRRLRKALSEFGAAIPKCDEPLKLIPKRDLFREDRYVGDRSDFVEMMASEAALPFEVQYQLDVCISQGVLHDSNIDAAFIQKLGSLPKDIAVTLLERIDDAQERRFDPMSIFDDDLGSVKSKDRTIPSHCVRVRKANVTPTTVHLTTPTVEPSNRVLRHFALQGDRFLRVQFMDEKQEGRLYIRESKCDKLLDRVAAVFKNGIRIGNLTFEFLAFGNSQFREHGAYFFAPTQSVSCADIRKWMGEVSDIKVIAKYCARLGQCFSTTRAIGIVKGDIEEIKDVERNGFQFTDGVGLMSPFLAEMIAIDMKVKKDNIVPSAYQFRLGGCKGVLSVSPRLKHRKVAIRKSQKKFDAEHVGFEINRVADYSSSALNRQLIIILSSLGVPDKVFIDKLKTMLRNLDLAMKDERICLQQLCKNVDQNGTSLLVAGWVRLGFMKVKEPFVMAMINLWRAWSIKYLKEKARIIIEEGAFVLGVADDSGESDDVPGVLQGHIDGTDQDDPNNWPEIFLQISDPEDRTQFRIITGPCVIARNPSLHPGDVRVVTAVDRKELHHHRNVVVFPRNGDRDVPHMLSGGDLDGDDYIIIWDKDLMPTVKNFPPMDYSAPPAKTKGEGEVNVDDMVEFFLDYMRNDRLGTIANSHLAWADEEEDGAMSERCRELALLHSKAVDFPKTGVPAELPRRLRVKKYPHFMEKNPKKTRRSTKIVGKLYDLVTKIDFSGTYEATFDERILSVFDDLDDLMETAAELKEAYDDSIRRTMLQHDINSEFEIFSGFVLKHSPEKNDYKYHEEIGAAFALMRDRFTAMTQKRLYELKLKEELAENEKVREELRLEEEEIKKKIVVTSLEEARMVAAIYTHTRDEVVRWNELIEEEDDADDYVPPFISFPWLFADVLGKIVAGDFSAV